MAATWHPTLSAISKNRPQIVPVASGCTRLLVTGPSRRNASASPNRIYRPTIGSKTNIFTVHVTLTFGQGSAPRTGASYFEFHVTSTTWWKCARIGRTNALTRSTWVMGGIFIDLWRTSDGKRNCNCNDVSGTRSDLALLELTYS